MTASTETAFDYGNAAALLGDAGNRDAFDVVLVEVGLAGASVDAGVSVIGALSGVVGGFFLHARHEVLERRGIAGAAVHGERKLGIQIIFDGAAERRVGGIEKRGSVGHGDGLIGAADGELQIQAEHAGVVDGDVLLEEPLKAFGNHFDVVSPGCRIIE